MKKKPAKKSPQIRRCEVNLRDLNAAIMDLRFRLDRPQAREDTGLLDTLRLQGENHERIMQAVLKAAQQMANEFNKLADVHRRGCFECWLRKRFSWLTKREDHDGTS